MVSNKASFLKLKYNMKKKNHSKSRYSFENLILTKTHYNDSPTCSGPTYRMGKTTNKWPRG